MAAHKTETDVKGALYAWLGRHKYPPPEYDAKLQPTRRGRKEHYKCEVRRVDGIDYTAVGNSKTKKDAMTNAAHDMCQYLLRTEKMTPVDVPQLTRNQLEGGDVASGSAARGAIPPSTPPHTHSSVGASNDGTKKQSDGDGDWTISDSKMRLNEYAQKSGQTLDYKFVRDGPPHKTTFTAELRIYSKEVRQYISGRAEARTKKQAQSLCALSIMKELYRAGVVKECHDRDDTERRHQADTTKPPQGLPEIEVKVHPELERKLSEHLNDVGVTPVREPWGDEPVSLAVDARWLPLPPIREDDTSNRTTPSWYPPAPNWHPWRGANIRDGPLLFKSMEQLSADLLSEDRDVAASGRNEQMNRFRQNLPVFSRRGDILDAIRSNSVVLIKGETGCGKTTQVCQYLLESCVLGGEGAGFAALVTQPRRISAVSVSERVAVERGESLGVSVGYSVRFDSVLPRPHGAILFCTVDTLLRKLDSGLTGISHVIVDEVQDRDLNTDLLLILLRDMVRVNRQLRVVLLLSLSAVSDTQIFCDYFGGCPMIEIAGGVEPVKFGFLDEVVDLLEDFMPAEGESNDNEATSNDPDQEENLNTKVDAEYGRRVQLAVSRLPENRLNPQLITALLRYITSMGLPGSVLIFVPSRDWIEKLRRFLQQDALFATAQLVILPLHDESQLEDVKRAHAEVANGVTKIILSTDITQTNMTIDDVVFVIDLCKCEVKRKDEFGGATFSIEWASKTTLAQRRMRAGRKLPGIAYHLCSRARYERLPWDGTAEILRAPLLNCALLVKSLGVGSIGGFLQKAIQPPPPDVVSRAEIALKEMDALDRNSQLTPLGRILARLPIDPIMGKTVVLASILNVFDAVSTMAAMVSDDTSTWGLPDLLSAADHVVQIAIFREWERARSQGEQAARDFCERTKVDATRMHRIKQIKTEIKEVLTRCGIARATVVPSVDELDLLGTLLLHAFYPRVAVHQGGRQLLTATHGTAVIDAHSTVFDTFIPVDRSPSMFVYGQLKRATSKEAAVCQQLKKVSPLQLLLFGARKVQNVGGVIKLDDWITLRMSHGVAARVVVLRVCVDSLLVTTCGNPQSVANPSDADRRLIDILTQLSRSDACRTRRLDLI